MTVISEIITASLRESNVIAANATVPDTARDEAFARLKVMILAVLGAEIGYILEDWNVTGSAIYRPSGIPVSSANLAGFTVKPNSRLMCNLAEARTITLDPLPQDGQRFEVVDIAGSFDTYNLTIDPNGRKLAGATGNAVIDTAGFAQQYFYRSDIGDWVTLVPADTTEEMPYPEDFDDYFIIGLAKRLNPRYGRELSPLSQERYAQQQAHFAARYAQTRLRITPPQEDA